MEDGGGVREAGPILLPQMSERGDGWEISASRMTCHAVFQQAVKKQTPAAQDTRSVVWGGVFVAPRCLGMFEHVF